jgi:hypothetical protein
MAAMGLFWTAVSHGELLIVEGSARQGTATAHSKGKLWNQV